MTLHSEKPLHNKQRMTPLGDTWQERRCKHTNAKLHKRANFAIEKRHTCCSPTSGTRATSEKTCTSGTRTAHVQNMRLSTTNETTCAHHVPPEMKPGCQSNLNNVDIVEPHLGAHLWCLCLIRHCRASRTSKLRIPTLSATERAPPAFWATEN